MNPPIISVVMPAYKVAPYIGEALESVLAQSFTDYEVIVVNDGSPDTPELEAGLERFGARIVYIKQENRGVSAARNQALRAARGQFVAFLDADDLWLPNYLREQFAFIQEHNADLVCADATQFGDSLVTNRTYMEELMPTSAAAGEVTFLGLVSGAQALVTSGVLARRKPVIEVGLFDEALRDSEDFDLWLRLARHGARMLYHRVVLLQRRCHQDSLSGDVFNVLTRALRAYDRVECWHDLSAAEHEEVLAIIRERRTLLEFELGKLHLAAGDFAAARESFARANELKRSWKTRVALSFSSLAPRVMKAIYLRRLGNAYAK
jgi:glycosyltransferase involved in cell wall biosynthesis